MLGEFIAEIAAAIKGKMAFVPMADLVSVKSPG